MIGVYNGKTNYEVGRELHSRPITFVNCFCSGYLLARFIGGTPDLILTPRLRLGVLLLKAPLILIPKHLPAKTHGGLARLCHSGGEFGNKV